MEDRYRYTREEVLRQLDEVRGTYGHIPWGLVSCMLLELAPTTEDIRWARQTSRKHRFIGNELPCDPRMEQILALDT